MDTLLSPVGTAHETSWSSLSRQADLEGSLIALTSSDRSQLSSEALEAAAALPALAGALRTLLSAEADENIDFESLAEENNKAASFSPAASVSGSLGGSTSRVVRASLRVRGVPGRSLSRYFLLSARTHGDCENIALRQLGCYTEGLPSFSDGSMVAITEEDRVVVLTESSGIPGRIAPFLGFLGALGALVSCGGIFIAGVSWLLEGEVIAPFAPLLALLVVSGLAMYACDRLLESVYTESPLAPDHSSSLVASLLADAISRRIDFWRSWRKDRREVVADQSWRVALEECAGSAVPAV